jgi:hypothetical protein
LVMADGVITEAGHPHDLLSKYLGDVLLTHPRDDAGTTEGSSSLPERIHGGRGGDEDAEFTLPAPVLDPPVHSLAAMVLQLGPSMTLQLRLAAAVAWQKHQQQLQEAPRLVFSTQ